MVDKSGVRRVWQIEADQFLGSKPTQPVVLEATVAQLPLPGAYDEHLVHVGVVGGLVGLCQLVYRAAAGGVDVQLLLELACQSLRWPLIEEPSWDHHPV